MKRFAPQALTFLTVLAAATACTSRRGSNQHPATGGSTGSAHSADHHDVHGTGSGNPGDRHLVSDSGQHLNGGNNHHFAARPHVAHLPAPVTTPPNLQALPRFVDNSSQCFVQEREHHYYPMTKPTPRKRHAPYASGRSFGATAPRPAPSSAARPKSAASGEGSSAGTQALRGPSRPPRDSVAPPPSPPAPQESEWAPLPEAEPGAEPHRADAGYGAAVYLSNDDTMSLSSAQRLIFAIDEYAPIEPNQVRPHELLNYFSFHTAAVPRDHDFSVIPSVAPSPENPDLWSLGFAIKGRPLSVSTRRNANLSFVVDRSGSMSAEGRMDYVKRGMLRSLQELKTGDIVNVTLFDTNTCHLAQNFVVGRDSMSRLSRVIERIQPRGSTNLYDGLNAGYQAADRVYQPGYTNRVIMVTDANTNTGVTNEQIISLVGKHYDSRRIRLSGVGVGRHFNDSLLDRLTERGRGAYVFLGSDAEVDAVFGPRFVSMIETVANDVHFKLHLPPSLKMDTFYGEEASTVKERVQAIHYFANTSQMFLSDLRSKDGSFPGTDDVMLTVEYRDPETDEPRVEEFAWKLGDVIGDRRNIDKAFVVSTFARRLEKLAARPLPSTHARRRHGYSDHEAATNCQITRSDLERLSSSVQSDPEVGRVKQLWDKYCERYQPVQIAHRDPRPLPDGQPSRPLRNNEFAPQDKWPSAVR